MRDDGQQPDNQPEAVDPSLPEMTGSRGEPDRDDAASSTPASSSGPPSPEMPAEAGATNAGDSPNDEPEPPIEMPEGDPEPHASAVVLGSGGAVPADVPADATAGLDPGRSLLEPEPAGDIVPAPSFPASGELEEITLPSSVSTLDPLAPGSAIGPNAEVTIAELTDRRGRVNYYRGTIEVSGTPAPIDVLEAPEDHAGFSRTAEVLDQVRYAMLPKLHLAWVAEGRRYLVTDQLESSTLDEALDEGMSTDGVVSTVLQLTQATRRLHGAGWALVGLSPDGVRLGQPLRITQLGTATRIGEMTTSPLHVAGYSAPELVEPVAITGKEDVYTLGAILYRGLTGRAIAEEGPELGSLSATLRTPAAPQLLAAALAPLEGRADLETFYQGLLAFKRRLSTRPIALRVASGTSIGLNQTRSTNEDACGYLTWSSAWEGRVAYNALLCMIDGMGGMEAGEVAATSALRAVLRRTGEYAIDRIASAPGRDREPTSSSSNGAQESLDVRELIHAAAEAAFTAAQGRQVGATITCVAIEDGTLRLGHVGDTRAYLLRDGVLTRLTRDHSLVAAMVASGVITPEEAEHHPESNKVLRSLGGMRHLPEGYIDDLTVAYGQPILELHEGDRLLLCSDGIWGVLNDDALLGILNESEECEVVVARAIDLALEGGAPDNAAIIVAHCSVMPAS